MTTPTTIKAEYLRATAAEAAEQARAVAAEKALSDRIAALEGPGALPPTGDVQAALTALPSGATLRLTSGATYTLPASLRADGKRNVTLDLNGATIKTNLPPGTVWAGTQELLFLRDWQGCTIKGGTIVGSHDQPGVYTSGRPEFQAGIAFVGGVNNVVANMTIRNNMGDGVGAYTMGGVAAQGIAVRDCDISGTGRWGVCGTHVSGFTVERTHFDNMERVFEFEPDPASPAHEVSDVLCQDNLITGRQVHLLGIYGPGNTRRITIQRNTVKAGANRGIWSYIEPTAGFRCYDLTFVNNTGEQSFAEDPGWLGVVHLTHADRAVLTGNTQPVKTAAMATVAIVDAPGAVVTPNSFTVVP